MYVRDIMVYNVVTIPSSTSIADAKRIMQAHHFRRLPVVDKGKLVGIVTEHLLESITPSKATSLSVWELGYLLEKTPVREIMERNVITATPDMTAEEAFAIANAHKVGSLPVLDGDKVMGMVTNSDFSRKIINPVLGIDQPGVRIEVTGGGEGKALEEIISIINRLGMEILTLHIEQLPEIAERNVCVHVSSEDVKPLTTELRSKGYTVAVRRR